MEHANTASFADEMRPRSLADFIGNPQVFDAQTGILSNLIRSANPECPPSILIAGPSGTGKTSLARVYCELLAEVHEKSPTFYAFCEIASNEYKKTLFDDLMLKCQSFSRHAILFIDEIHCLTSIEEATFLSFIEEEKLTLIGATTEPASERIIQGLRSRFTLLSLRPPDTRDVLRLLVKTLNVLRPLDMTLTLENEVDPKALCLLAKRSAQDFRKALELLQGAISGGRITMESAERVTETCFQGGDTTDEYFDAISGLQKSIRASDPQGAIFFLAVLLRIESDPLAICRRLIVIASEDVGLADPQALCVAVSCYQAVECVGIQEGRLALAECALYLAKANKSNSAYMALANASKWLEENEDRRDLWRPRPGYRRSCAGDDYKYPHDLGGQILDSALQDEVQEIVFYRDREW